MQSNATAYIRVVIDGGRAADLARASTVLGKPRQDVLRDAIDRFLRDILPSKVGRQCLCLDITAGVCRNSVAPPMRASAGIDVINDSPR